MLTEYVIIESIIEEVLQKCQEVSRKTFSLLSNPGTAFEDLFAAYDTVLKDSSLYSYLQC